MRRLIRNIFIQALVICALVTAGISPACAFIAGKSSLIEICGPDGLMMVSVPADNAPGGDEAGDAGYHGEQTDCGYCIAQASGKAITTPPAAIIDFDFVYDAPRFARADSFTAYALDGRMPARGPPAFL